MVRLSGNAGRGTGASSGSGLGGKSGGNTSKGRSSNGFQPVPESLYTVVLKEFAEKQTKKGDGVYIDGKFEIVEGDQKGMLIYNKFIIDHTSEKAAEIGKEQLNRFLKAAGASNGLADLDFDTSRLTDYTNRLVVANVKIEKGTNGYSDRNKITNFSVR